MLRNYRNGDFFDFVLQVNQPLFGNRFYFCFELYNDLPR
jgi:hypothetical protein